MSEEDTIPFISFDEMDGVLEISGRSILEYPDKVFQPLLVRVMEYLCNPAEKTSVVMNFEYINTASVKWVFHILGRMEKAYVENHHVVEVKYYYADENILETGKYLQINLALPIDLIKSNS